MIQGGVRNIKRLSSVELLAQSGVFMPAVAGRAEVEWWTSFRGRDSDGDCFDIEWHHLWNRVTPRENGITGWGVDEFAEGSSGFGNP